MEIQAVYPRPRISILDDWHKVYPYLLKGLKIDCTSQLWAREALAKGFMHLAPSSLVQLQGAVLVCLKYLGHVLLH
jgi:hypothetical protein